MSTDFVRAKRHAAFGTRLRRLSEALDRQVQALYRAHDSSFEPRWFAVVAALGEGGAFSVGELAALLGITHAAVSQTRAELERAGLIRVTTDPEDRRRQVISLSAKGERTVKALAPLWRAIAQATQELCAREAPDLLAQLDRIDEALARTSLQARTDAILQSKRKRPGTARHATL